MAAPTAYPEGNGGYPEQQVNPGMAYDPMKQPMGPGVQVANPPPYQPYPAQAPPQLQPQPQVSQQQSSNNNVVVVSQQPATVPTTVHVTHSDQSSLIFALVVSLIAFFCLCWWTLLCSVPGIVLGCLASEAGSSGDIEKKRLYDKISVGLTVTGIICEVVGPIIIIVVTIGAVFGTTAATATAVGTSGSIFNSNSRCYTTSYYPYRVCY